MYVRIWTELIRQRNALMQYKNDITQYYVNTCKILCA